MILNGTYQIRDLQIENLEIIDFEIEDNTNEKTCIVSVIVKVPNSIIYYGYEIPTQFTYVNTYNDNDIEQFISTELEKLKL